MTSVSLIAALRFSDEMHACRLGASMDTLIEKEQGTFSKRRLFSDDIMTVHEVSPWTKIFKFKGWIIEVNLETYA